jgi:hypothetical protein
MSKELRKIRLTSTNGEIHYVYEEYCCLPEWIVENKGCCELEAMEVSKLEASKPLYLSRG